MLTLSDLLCMNLNFDKFSWLRTNQSFFILAISNRVNFWRKKFLMRKKCSFVERSIPSPKMDLSSQKRCSPFITSNDILLSSRKNSTRDKKKFLRPPDDPKGVELLTARDDQFNLRWSLTSVYRQPSKKRDSNRTLLHRRPISLKFN